MGSVSNGPVPAVWPQRQYVHGAWHFAIFGRARTATTFLNRALWGPGGTWPPPALDFKKFAFGVAWTVCDCNWDILDLAHQGDAAVLTVRENHFTDREPFPCSTHGCDTEWRPVRLFVLVRIDRNWLGSIPHAAAVNEAPAYVGTRPPPNVVGD